MRVVIQMRSPDGLEYALTQDIPMAQLEDSPFIEIPITQTGTVLGITAYYETGDAIRSSYQISSQNVIAGSTLALRVVGEFVTEEPPSIDKPAVLPFNNEEELQGTDIYW